MTAPQGKGREDHATENLIGVTSKPVINNNDDERNDNILLFWGRELLSICDRKIQREYPLKFNAVSIQKTLTVCFASKV